MSSGVAIQNIECFNRALLYRHRFSAELPALQIFSRLQPVRWLWMCTNNYFHFFVESIGDVTILFPAQRYRLPWVWIQFRDLLVLTSIIRNRTNLVYSLLSLGIHSILSVSFIITH
jgi:hypothetical protein